MTAEVLTGNPGNLERKELSAAKKVTVPLGAEFKIGLEKGSPLSSTPETAKFTLSNQSFAEPLATRHLFPNNVVFAYQQGVNAPAKSFQAVHLGTARLTIASTADPQVAIELEIEVVRPDTLGNTRNNLDTVILDAAHRAGMLPHFGKGQMEQESFDPDAFRYEPRRDIDTIPNLIRRVPFSDYSAPDPRGPKLLNDDLEPREEYHFTRGGVTRRIQAGDVDVTISEIYLGSNCRGIRNGRCWGANWGGFVGNLIQQGDPRADADAQTPIASSYGWLQVMYYKAIEIGWTGIAGEVHPHYLFDRTASLGQRASSLYVGNEVNVLNWHAAHRNYADSPQFANYQEFENALEAMYHRYNPAWSNATYPNYESAIVDKSKHYLPSRSGSIFN